MATKNDLSSMFNIKRYDPTAVPIRKGTLPYTGETYNPAGGAGLESPTPLVGNKVDWANNIIPVQPPGGQATTNNSIFSGGGAATPAPSAGVDLYAKYRDPNTGNIMSPEEYAIYLGNKVPKGNGQIPNYAGDAMTNPNETSNQLITRATNLNNARNDIATGERDPYGVGNKSGIAYSPAELRAIEKAYAGVYDPALNDVFSRLRDKQAEEEKKANREDIIFKTNESIRQWRATTGTKGGGSGDKSIFTPTQLHKAASNAGLEIEDMKLLDNDIINFYLNPPQVEDEYGTKQYAYKLFREDLAAIENGDLDPNQFMEEITEGNLPEAVKTYFIEQIPTVPVEEKEGYFKRIWNAIKGK